MLERARAEILGVIPGVQDISVAARWKWVPHGTTGVTGLEDNPLGNAVALKEYS